MCYAYGGSPLCPCLAQTITDRQRDSNVNQIRPDCSTNIRHGMKINELGCPTITQQSLQ